MAQPVWTDISIAPPSADVAVRTLPNKHGFYLKVFGGTAESPTPVTTFDEADNFADLIPGALPFTKTVDAESRVMLSGVTLRGARTVTADNQTVRIEVYLGEDKYELLADRDISEPSALLTGTALAFARTYPDGSAIVGVANVEAMNPEGDPEATQFGYDVEFSFPTFERVSVLAPEV